MDRPSGGGHDNRGRGGGAGSDGNWRVRKYDATNQIKQLLGVPTEDDKPVVDTEVRTPPQNIPRHRQGQIMNDHLLDRSGSPSNRNQRWENHRYHDNKHRNENYESPGRNHHRQYDQNRTPPHRYQEMRQRQDSYGSPGNHRIGSYDRGYNNSPRNQLRDLPKDLRDIRANGPRHINTSMSGPGGIGPEVEAPDFRPSPEVLAELEEQFLYPLKKKSLKFPKAKYFCRLCDYHCDSLVVCRRHITDNRHKKLKEAKDVDTSLRSMPPLSEAHIAVIDRKVRAIAEEMEATPKMMQQRRDAVAQLDGFLTAKVEGCHLEMVGSSLSGFCLKTSDVNIDVVMDDNLNPSTALLAVKELVGKSDVYKDVLDDLSSSFPTMSFTHAQTGLRMVVGACSPSSKLTNQLFADYASLDPRVKVLGIAFRYWAQLCQIDNQGRGTLPPHVFPLMVIYFLQQHMPTPILPVLHTLHPKPDGDVYLSPSELGNKWTAGCNTQSIGRLWVELFRFYAIGFKITEYVINVRQLIPMTRAEKTWSKKIAVEDPFLQKRNLTRTVSGNPVFEYIVDRFKMGFRYFAIPQMQFGPLFEHIVVKDVHSQSEGSSECELEKTDDDLEVTVEESEDDDDPSNISGCEQDLSSLALEEDLVDVPNIIQSTNGTVIEDDMPTVLEKIKATIPLLTPTQAAKLLVQIQEHHVNFKFDSKIFRSGLNPPLICGSCQKEGHCKADCREDELPPLKVLPFMKPFFINKLTEIFEKLMREFEPCTEEIEERDRIVADLEFYIRQFFRGVSLELFGSSANGFGFQHSDLDICLTFEGNPTGQDIDHIKVIESLAEKLKKYRQCGHVFAITTAKVPIVKFSIRRAALEGDLSLYNTLALQNTKLLAAYAKIDYRVKCLGYGMKYFAKLCDIGDASRGSLSSYAYILMVLHFLQQCKPPVIPVLQELYDHSKPGPQLMIDGWNAWFFTDLHQLPKVWKDCGKNKESVGQLWVSMLRYYTETFNWKEHVVTIRQHAPLTRLQKLWNSRCIVIEDPFDLSHNLGAGLSRKMNTFIMKAFIRGREVFGSPLNAVPPGYRHLVDYLFDTKHLTDGAPPNDRGCRFCGKIGHIQKDCPKKKLNQERREKKDRQKDHRQEHRMSSDMNKEDSPPKPDSRNTPDKKHSDDVRGRNGSIGSANETPTTRSAKDVATGKSTGPTTSTTKVANSQIDSRVIEQPQGKTSYKVSNPVIKSTNQSSVFVDSTRNSKPLDCDDKINVDSCAEVKPIQASGHLRLNSKTNQPPVSNSSFINGPTTADCSSSISRPTSMNVSSISEIRDSSEKLSGQSSTGLTIGGLSIPPGFHTLGHGNLGSSYASQIKSVKEQVSQVMASNQSSSPNNKLSKAVGHGDVRQSSIGPNQYNNPIEKPQQIVSAQPKQQQQKYSGSWKSDAITPPYLATKPQDLSKKEQIPPSPVPISSAQNHQQQQQQQQQYYFSISPAALFHMASQAAGGQLSAVLMPNASEGNNIRTNSSLSSTSSLGTPNTSVNAPPPPPGFSTPVTINYPQNQQLESMPYNKLVMGSPLYRSPVSQAEGQPVVTSTVSPSFMTPMGQTIGNMAGVYTLQQNSGGNQFANITPTANAHSPHAMNDPNLSQQQQIPFCTKQFLSQVSQGMHQGVPQGVPQSMPSVPSGIPQGVTQAVPQGLQTGPPPVPPGLSTSVPQGVSQGMHQTLTGGVPQVSMGSALSPAMQQVPIGHHLPQPYPQPNFPQQGYQMAMAGPGGFYPEYVFGDPLQNTSPNAQGPPPPPTLPAEMMTDMTFQRPDVYDSQMPQVPQFLASSLPQHQNLIPQISQPHPGMGMGHQHGPPAPPTGHGPTYTPTNVIFIEGERDGSQILQ